MKTGIFAALLVTMVTAFLGCQSYQLKQRNVFSDEDGNLVQIDYGRSDTDHVNTFISPVTGREMDFKSKLMVRVVLPNGEVIIAWQCMNFLSRGTMYKTDNERWMLLTAGFSCTIYRQTEDDPTRYDEVYRGVLCDTPEIKIEKNDKWRELPRTKREYKKP